VFDGLSGGSDGEGWTMLEFIRDFAPHFASDARVEDVSSFDAVEAELDAKLPADYKAFLMWADGGETVPPATHVKFYPLSELLPRRADGQPTGTLEFATDDSSGFAFDMTIGRGGASYPIVMYPLGDATREDLELVAEEFRHFLQVVVDPSARYRRWR
jgi:hypothetical protein